MSEFLQVTLLNKQSYTLKQNKYSRNKILVSKEGSYIERKIHKTAVQMTCNKSRWSLSSKLFCNVLQRSIYNIPGEYEQT